jgi:serine/threonine protein phosphatase PrpC
LVKRWGAGLTAVIYFCVNGMLAHSVESNFWAERGRAARRARGAESRSAALPLGAGLADRVLHDLTAQNLRAPLGAALSQSLAARLPKDFAREQADLFNAIPLDLGTVRSVQLPPGGKPDRVVVYLQDVHRNVDAQTHLSGLLGNLFEKKQIDLAGLEAAFGPLDVKGLRSFPDPSALKASADYFLKTKGITGSLHAAVTGPEAAYIGVDDRPHYDANVQAYLQSRVTLEADQKAATQALADVNARKAALFTGSLKELDRAVTAHHADKMSLGDYVKALARDGVPADMESVRAFLSALEMESSLNFKEVERQRDGLTRRLVKGLDKAGLQDLLDHTVAYKAGQVRYAEFYSYLGRLCSRAGVNLEKDFPAMAGYVRYVLAADGIQAETLLADLTRLEDLAYSRLARTPEEKALVAEGRRLALTAKLVDFSLTPEEWKAWTLQNGPGPNSTVPVDLSPYEAFYKEAQARDEAIFHNFLAALESHRARRAAILTGGFHTDAIARRLLDKNIAVVTVAPKITDLESPSGATALSVFAQEKTPLEQLFAGEKLYLGEPVADRGAKMMPMVFLAGMVALVVRKLTEEEFVKFFNRIRANGEPELSRVELNSEETGGVYKFTGTDAYGKQSVSVASSIDTAGHVSSFSQGDAHRTAHLPLLKRLKGRVNATLRSFGRRTLEILWESLERRLSRLTKNYVVPPGELIGSSGTKVHQATEKNGYQEFTSPNGHSLLSVPEIDPSPPTRLNQDAALLWDDVGGEGPVVGVIIDGMGDMGDGKDAGRAVSQHLADFIAARLDEHPFSPGESNHVIAAKMAGLVKRAQIHLTTSPPPGASAMAGAVLAMAVVVNRSGQRDLIALTVGNGRVYALSDRDGLRSTPDNVIPAYREEGIEIPLGVVALDGEGHVERSETSLIRREMGLGPLKEGQRIYQRLDQILDNRKNEQDRSEKRKKVAASPLVSNPITVGGTLFRGSVVTIIPNVTGSVAVASDGVTSGVTDKAMESLLKNSKASAEKIMNAVDNHTNDDRSVVIIRTGQMKAFGAMGAWSLRVAHKVETFLAGLAGLVPLVYELLNQGILADPAAVLSRLALMDPTSLVLHGLAAGVLFLFFGHLLFSVRVERAGKQEIVTFWKHGPAEALKASLAATFLKASPSLLASVGTPVGLFFLTQGGWFIAAGVLAIAGGLYFGSLLHGMANGVATRVGIKEMTAALGRGFRVALAESVDRFFERHPLLFPGFYIVPPGGGKAPPPHSFKVEQNPAKRVNKIHEGSFFTNAETPEYNFLRSRGVEDWAPSFFKVVEYWMFNASQGASDKKTILMDALNRLYDAPGSTQEMTKEGLRTFLTDLLVQLPERGYGMTKEELDRSGVVSAILAEVGEHGQFQDLNSFLQKIVQVRDLRVGMMPRSIQQLGLIASVIRRWGEDSSEAQNQADFMRLLEDAFAFGKEGRVRRMEEFRERFSDFSRGSNGSKLRVVDPGAFINVAILEDVMDAKELADLALKEKVDAVKKGKGSEADLRRDYFAHIADSLGQLASSRGKGVDGTLDVELKDHQEKMTTFIKSWMRELEIPRDRQTHFGSLGNLEEWIADEIVGKQSALGKYYSALIAQQMVGFVRKAEMRGDDFRKRAGEALVNLGFPPGDSPEASEIRLIVLRTLESWVNGDNLPRGVPVGIWNALQAKNNVYETVKIILENSPPSITKRKSSLLMNYLGMSDIADGYRDQIVAAVALLQQAGLRTGIASTLTQQQEVLIIEILRSQLVPVAAPAVAEPSVVREKAPPGNFVSMEQPTRARDGTNVFLPQRGILQLIGFEKGYRGVVNYIDKRNGRPVKKPHYEDSAGNKIDPEPGTIYESALGDWIRFHSEMVDFQLFISEKGLSRYVITLKTALSPDGGLLSGAFHRGLADEIKINLSRLTYTPQSDGHPARLTGTYVAQLNTRAVVVRSFSINLSPKEGQKNTDYGAYDLNGEISVFSPREIAFYLDELAKKKDFPKGHKVVVESKVIEGSVTKTYYVKTPDGKRQSVLSVLRNDLPASVGFRAVRDPGTQKSDAEKICKLHFYDIDGRAISVSVSEVPPATGNSSSSATLRAMVLPLGIGLSGAWALLGNLFVGPGGPLAAGIATAKTASHVAQGAGLASLGWGIPAVFFGMAVGYIAFQYFSRRRDENIIRNYFQGGVVPGARELKVLQNLLGDGKSADGEAKFSADLISRIKDQLNPGRNPRAKTLFATALAGTGITQPQALAALIALSQGKAAPRAAADSGGNEIHRFSAYEPVDGEGFINFIKETQARVDGRGQEDSPLLIELLPRNKEQYDKLIGAFGAGNETVVVHLPPVTDETAGVAFLTLHNEKLAGRQLTTTFLQSITREEEDTGLTQFAGENATLQKLIQGAVPLYLADIAAFIELSRRITTYA